MKKFAFLVHLRSSYRKDLALMAPPLGWVPDSVYRYALRNRPLPPFVWSEVKLRPEATEAEGYIIMVPYSGQQLLEQQKAMLPRIDQALELAASKGAEIVGLGALTSPITLGGKLLLNNPHVSITNGNAYTAVITFQRISELIRQSSSYSPKVALVGATGSVGSLVSLLLAKHHPEAQYLLMARNERKIVQLEKEMKATNPFCSTTTSLDINDVRQADIVVLLTSASDCILQGEHLKHGAIVLDDTQPRNTNPDIVKQRPDVTIIDGGLVSVPNLQLTRSIGLPRGLSYACLAETMLLAQAGYKGHFSVGNPTLNQAEYIAHVGNNFAHLGFGVAPDHSFGKLILPSAPQAKQVAFEEGFSLQVA
ncbi:MAG: shikimate dehydrogenase [Spirosomataceae bacterium]